MLYMITTFFLLPHQFLRNLFAYYGVSICPPVACMIGDDPGRHYGGCTFGSRYADQFKPRL